MKPQRAQRTLCSPEEILRFTQNDKYTACHAEQSEASLVFGTNERT
ncbi:MAG: hypothetical protein U0937_01895 [Thermodesulfovibrionia bacterium]|nr:hypothetical protein [Thermodesulfovibrionia bacterium]